MWSAVGLLSVTLHFVLVLTMEINGKMITTITMKTKRNYQIPAMAVVAVEGANFIAASSKEVTTFEAKSQIEKATWDEDEE